MFTAFTQTVCVSTRALYDRTAINSDHSNNRKYEPAMVGSANATHPCRIFGNGVLFRQQLCDLCYVAAAGRSNCLCSQSNLHICSHHHHREEV